MGVVGGMDGWRDEWVGLEYVGLEWEMGFFDFWLRNIDRCTFCLSNLLSVWRQRIDNLRNRKEKKKSSHAHLSFPIREKNLTGRLDLSERVTTFFCRETPFGNSSRNCDICGSH